LSARAAPEPEEISRRQQPAAGRWRLRLEVDEPGSRVATAIDDDGALIGLATAGVTRDRDRATEWELYSIHVTEQQQGTGMADDLIRLAARCTDPCTDIAVWVHRENGRAQGFYRRHGFALEGAARADEITGACEVRMVRRCVRR
jgi:ribosomal protein S18 acetylase RimI-like enzyme